MEEHVKPNSLKAWFLASRPKTWAAAIAPVIVGSALAYHHHSFKPIAALCCLLFAVAMQIAANLINDLYDFLKGSDREDRLGPLRATAQGWILPSAMKKGIIAVIALGCICGSVLIYYAGWQMIFVGLFCVVFAYLYTSGPFPLAYNGLGDIAVILFFGLIAVGFSAYVQVCQWDRSFILCGLATGLVVNTLLVLNNYRDREQDEISGKRTSVVLLGERFGRYLYLLMGILAVILITKYVFNFSYIKFPQLLGSLVNTDSILPTIAKFAAFPILICIYLIPHVNTWLKICEIRSGERLNSMIGETSRNMILFAATLTITLCLH